MKRSLLFVAVLLATLLFVPTITAVSQSSAAVTTTTSPTTSTTSATTSPTPRFPCNVVASASVEVLSRSNPCVVLTHVGASFSIRFNAGQHWSVPRLSAPLLLVVKIATSTNGPTTMTVRALSSGTGTLTSMGRPICAKGIACPMYLILWSLDVVVSTHRDAPRVSVNAANSAQHITLHLGGLLRVALAGTTIYTWTEPTSSNAATLRRLAGTSGSTAHALFVATSTGRVMVSAVHNPTCYPACLPPSRLFEVVITVIN